MVTPILCLTFLYTTVIFDHAMKYKLGVSKNRSAICFFSLAFRNVLPHHAISNTNTQAHQGRVRMFTAWGERVEGRAGQSKGFVLEVVVRGFETL